MSTTRQEEYNKLVSFCGYFNSWALNLVYFETFLPPSSQKLNTRPKPNLHTRVFTELQSRKVITLLHTYGNPILNQSNPSSPTSARVILRL